MTYVRIHLAVSLSTNCINCSSVKFISFSIDWPRTSENIVITPVFNALSNGDSLVKLSLRFPMTAEV